jgi:hypothetical protein
MLADRVPSATDAPLPAHRRRPSRLLLVALFLLVVATPDRAAAQPPAQPLAPLDQDAVDRAIQVGVQYLRRSQQPQGHWGTGTGPNSDKGWAVGYTCLAGITLLECGVPTGDPGLQNAAKGIRDYARKGEIDSTYEVALAILFLDRMKEKSDRQLIQTLGARLIAGQTPTGGWGYKVPKTSAADAQALFTALRRINPPQPAPVPSPRARPSSLGLCVKASDDFFFRSTAVVDVEKARAAAIANVPGTMKKLPVLQEPGSLVLDDPKDKRNDPTTGTTDNSNTHFAILGLWAARRHDVPAERSFALLARRFRTSQGPGGTWTYDYSRAGADGGPQFTCIALLGLAIGHVIDPDAAVRPEQDPRILNAFVALSKRIGEPAGQFDNRPTLKDAGGLYFLWAMERIAVLYDVQKLDKKDWYRWGAEILIGHQANDGSWTEDGGYPGQHPVLNTCLALMFLKRANLTPDLSRRLTVDTAALTAKVDDKVSPKVEPPAPKPPEPTPPAPKTEPPPKREEVVRPRPETPPAPAPAPETPPAATTTETKSNSWIWIVLLVVLALAGGGIALFAARRRRRDDDDDEEEEDDEDDDDEEEEERPRKKKRKKKARAEED